MAEITVQDLRDRAVMAPVAQRGRGVLDTITFIMRSRITDATLVPEHPLITAVTLAELSAGPLVACTDEERAVRQAHLQQAEADFEPLPFDDAAARAFGRVAASRCGAGRNVTATAYDAYDCGDRIGQRSSSLHVQSE
jgi:predicted nucleic acid-binding protein